MPEHDDTLPITDDTTEPTPLVKPGAVTIPVEHFELATEIDVPKPAFTPERLTPATPRPTSVGDPVIALAKPKKTSASFIDRKYRLPTESEISAAVDGTPTDEVPVID